VSDINAATLDQTTLTFTPANWNLPQRVVFRPIDDHVINPDKVVNITVSVVAALSDDAYDSVASKTFSATIRNDDFAAADYDHNGLVEQADYNTWRSNFGGNANLALAADGNRNGSVDAADYVFWLKKIGTPGAGAAVGSSALASDLSERAVVNTTPVVDSRATKTVDPSAPKDEAFSSLARGIWLDTGGFNELAGSTDAVLMTEAGVPGAQADLLLLIHDQGSLERFDHTPNSPARDASDETSDPDYATALIDAWPTLD
jgi:hypothetical protein